MIIQRGSTTPLPTLLNIGVSYRSRNHRKPTQFKFHTSRVAPESSSQFIYQTIVIAPERSHISWVHTEKWQVNEI